MGRRLWRNFWQSAYNNWRDGWGSEILWETRDKEILGWLWFSQDWWIPHCSRFGDLRRRGRFRSLVRIHFACHEIQLLTIAIIPVSFLLSESLNDVLILAVWIFSCVSASCWLSSCFFLVFFSPSFLRHLAFHRWRRAAWGWLEQFSALLGKHSLFHIERNWQRCHLLTHFMMKASLSLK